MNRRSFVLCGLALAAWSAPAAATNHTWRGISGSWGGGEPTWGVINKPKVIPYKGRQIVNYKTKEPPGTIIIDTAERWLYHVRPGGKAVRYGVGVGRDGFNWSGVALVGEKKEWPEWRPPAEMKERESFHYGRQLPDLMPGGPENPLGARALYLHQDGQDTLYRIHGTNQPQTIRQAVSSGCIRMLNKEVIELYKKVPIGTKVIVL